MPAKPQPTPLAYWEDRGKSHYKRGVDIDQIISQLYKARNLPVQNAVRRGFRQALANDDSPIEVKANRAAWMKQAKRQMRENESLAVYAAAQAIKRGELPSQRDWYPEDSTRDDPYWNKRGRKATMSKAEFQTRIKALGFDYKWFARRNGVPYYQIYLTKNKTIMQYYVQALIHEETLAALAEILDKYQGPIPKKEIVALLKRAEEYLP